MALIALGFRGLPFHDPFHEPEQLSAEPTSHGEQPGRLPT